MFSSYSYLYFDIHDVLFKFYYIQNIHNTYRFQSYNNLNVHTGVHKSRRKIADIHKYKFCFNVNQETANFYELGFCGFNVLARPVCF